MAGDTDTDTDTSVRAPVPVQHLLWYQLRCRACHPAPRNSQFLRFFKWPAVFFGEGQGRREICGLIQHYAQVLRPLSESSQRLCAVPTHHIFVSSAFRLDAAPYRCLPIRQSFSEIARTVSFAEGLSVQVPGGSPTFCFVHDHATACVTDQTWGICVWGPGGAPGYWLLFSLSSDDMKVLTQLQPLLSDALFVHAAALSETIDKLLENHKIVIPSFQFDVI
jgi:hypothetical protein